MACPSHPSLASRLEARGNPGVGLENPSPEPLSQPRRMHPPSETFTVFRVSTLWLIELSVSFGLMKLRKFTVMPPSFLPAPPTHLPLEVWEVSRGCACTPVVDASAEIRVGLEGDGGDGQAQAHGWKEAGREKRAGRGRRREKWGGGEKGDETAILKPCSGEPECMERGKLA